MPGLDVLITLYALLITKTFYDSTDYLAVILLVYFNYYTGLYENNLNLPAM
jgi:hypothetical protein